MTREQVKAAILEGRPTPGISMELFEACYMELLRAQHPDSRLVTLVESRSSRDGLPAGIHARVAAMLDGKRDIVRLSEARSDLKSDAFYDPPGRDDDTLGKILRAAAERFKARTDSDAITARARNLDGPPKRWTFQPAATLQEAIADAKRLPDGIHAAVANRLPNRGGR